MLKDFDNKVKIYLIFIYAFALSLAVLTFDKYGLNIRDNIVNIVFFAVLSIIAESMQVSFNQFAISTGFTVTLSTIVLFKPSAAIVIISIGILFRILKTDNKTQHIFNIPFYKTFFNVSILIISIVISSKIYELVGGRYGTDSKTMLVPIILLASSFFIIDYFLLCFLLHLVLKIKLTASIAQNAKIGLLSVIGMVPLGIIVLEAYKVYDYMGVIIVFGPILLARYCFVMYTSIKKAYLNTVKALSLAIEAKDSYTEGHSERVVYYAEKIARKMHFSESKIEDLKIAALLHDIGKIGIPEAILNKPGKLSEYEYSKIKEHPIIGANIIKDIDMLKNSVDVIKYHHERYDGKGYPEGISQDKVPLESYIIAISDAFDAMCSDRPYRKAMSREQAIEVIKQERGKQFHPKVVDTFIKILNAEREA